MISLNNKGTNSDLMNVTFVKRVSVGSLNPNNLLGEEQMEAQMTLLNKYLTEYPQGKIIGKEIAIGVYQMGEHQLTMQRITYHISNSPDEK